MLASGFRSTTGVLLIPLHEEFGWSHETIGLAVSLNLLCFGLGAPFAAALIERFGVRRVVGIALATISVSALLTVGMTEEWQLFLLWGLVNGSATGAVSVPLAAPRTSWAPRRRRGARASSGPRPASTRRHSSRPAGSRWSPQSRCR